MQDIVNSNQNLLDHTEGFESVLRLFESVIKNCDLPVLEIGTNMGGSSKCFLEILNNNKKSNYLIGVDPFGSVPYHNGAFQQESSQYENDRYYSSMEMLYGFAKSLKLDYTHFKVTSEDFIKMFPLLNLYKNSTTTKLNMFSFIYLDGSHDPEIVRKEVEFFKDKFDLKGAIVVDDWEESRFDGFVDKIIRENANLVADRSIPQRLVIKYNVENY